MTGVGRSVLPARRFRNIALQLRRTVRRGVTCQNAGSAGNTDGPTFGFGHGDQGVEYGMAIGRHEEVATGREDGIEPLPRGLR